MKARDRKTKRERTRERAREGIHKRKINLFLVFFFANFQLRF